VRVLQATNNGQEVALEDMRLRGAGQLFGQRQSGPADTGLSSLLTMTDLASDEDTLAAARAAAAALVAEHGFVGLPAEVRAALAAYRMTTLLALRMEDIDIHM
jgi:RecG-like helicase